MVLTTVPCPYFTVDLSTEGFRCVTSFSVYNHPRKWAFSSLSLGETEGHSRIPDMIKGREGGWCGWGSVCW